MMSFGCKEIQSAVTSGVLILLVLEGLNSFSIQRLRVTSEMDVIPNMTNMPFSLFI